MVEEKLEYEAPQRIEYKNYFIGKCISTGDTVNLVIGQLYLLKDRKGNKEHFSVSRHISNNDSHIGQYGKQYFEIVEDITQQIKAMPYQKGMAKQEIFVGVIKMRADNKGVTLYEAQKELLAEGTISKEYVDADGKEIGKFKTIYDKVETEEEFKVDPSTLQKRTKGSTAVNEFNESNKTDAELAAEYEEFVLANLEETKKKNAADSELGVTKPKTARTQVAKPNAAAKPKIVQRGLFG